MVNLARLAKQNPEKLAEEADKLKALFNLS